MIGAWCFVDHYGPTLADDAMSVARHPHAGLQTVSWLFNGEIEHRDSLGSLQLINPDQLNVMTSGHGIAHSELSLGAGKELHGVQLWVALPSAAKDVSPQFEHHSDLPTFDCEGMRVKLMMGSCLGHNSPARIYSPLMAAEIAGGNLETDFPIDPIFEYGILVNQGEITVNGKPVGATQLHYIPTGRSNIGISSQGKFLGLIIGGVPFKEEIIMWWNFIGRTHDEIVEMRSDWQNQKKRFGFFEDRIGGYIPAPALPNLRLKPRGSRRHS